MASNNQTTQSIVTVLVRTVHLFLATNPRREVGTIFHATLRNNTLSVLNQCAHAQVSLLQNGLILTCLLSGVTLTSTVPIVIASSVLLILCIAVVVFLLARRLKIKREPSVEQRDENPVYDMYYFSDGQHVDYGTSEVQDENKNYGT